MEEEKNLGLAKPETTGIENGCFTIKTEQLPVSKLWSARLEDPTRVVGVEVVARTKGESIGELMCRILAESTGEGYNERACIVGSN